jgi:DNA-directed RNA polymerase subunit M/transcription elongation factor TFIIS
MVTPGELRLVAGIAEDGVQLEPEVAEGGDVDYPTARGLLDDRDGEPIDVLEWLSARGVLTDEFVSKVYICPECSAHGMQYITVCPACGSADAVETTVFEHDCGYVGSREEFEDEEGYRCPDCGVILESANAADEQRYACRECTEVFDTPDDHLWCKDCLYMFPPPETIERPLYRYEVTDGGKRWLDRHRAARRTIAETLRERNLQTEVDTTVERGGEDHPVHVFAADDLFGERRLVEIYETPDTDRVESFVALAQAVDAHPIVVTTTGTVERGVAERAESAGLTLLSFTEDGTLETDYEVIEEFPEDRSVFERITAAVDVPAWKGQ